jgi:hypothetical protein
VESNLLLGTKSLAGASNSALILLPFPPYSLRLIPGSCIIQVSGHPSWDKTMYFREAPQDRPVADRKNRYCRLGINLDKPAVSEMPIVSPPDASGIMRGAIGFNADTKFKPLAPINRCIYCDAIVYADDKSRPLGAEHVVPEGLGGTLELPLSSCEKCEGKTSSIEGAAQRGHLLAVRRRQGLFGKKRNRKEPVTFASLVDGREVVIYPELDEHPTVLVLPRLHPPGLLFPQPGWGGIFFHPLIPLDTLRDKGVIDRFFTPTIDVYRFCQLIARIGHAFAVAAIGEDMFKPTLREWITRPTKKSGMSSGIYNVIGGFYPLFQPTANLHEVTLAFNQQGEEVYIIANIRLFANLAAPIYMAVVGSLANGQSAGEAHARLVERVRPLRGTSESTPGGS